MSAKRSAPSAGPSKRARFASPPPATAADISTSHLEDDLTISTAAKSKARRSLKGQEGYDSDSSDDGQGVVPSRNKKSAGGEDDMDEDEDIFGGGGGDEEEVEAAKDAKKEGKDFLNINDIQGQEFDGTTRIQNDEDDDLDSEEEAEAAARARGLDGPMGYEMTSFNMKAELTEGRMTADGENFISNDRDPGDEHDKWLDGMNRAEIKKARKGAKERERMELEREKKEEQDASDEYREERLMGEMVELLHRGETVLEALQRLGGEVEKERKKMEAESAGGHKKKTWAEKQRERKAMLQGATDGTMQVDSNHPPSHPFNRLSDLITSLQSLGHLDVYSMTRESLQRMIPAPPPTGEAPASASTPTQQIPTKTFEYRFSKPYLASLPPAQRPIEREVFGPFPFPALMQWRQSGAFGGPDCTNVELRRAGPTPGAWGTWKEAVENEMMAVTS